MGHLVGPRFANFKEISLEAKEQGFHGIYLQPRNDSKAIRITGYSQEALDYVTSLLDSKLESWEDRNAPKQSSNLFGSWCDEIDSSNLPYVCGSYRPSTPTIAPELTTPPPPPVKFRNDFHSETDEWSYDD